MARLITRVAPASLRDTPLRAILQACYDIYREGQTPTFNLVTARIEDPAVRDLVVELLDSMKSAPIPPGTNVLPWRKVLCDSPIEVQLASALDGFDRRELQEHIRNLQIALRKIDSSSDPRESRALLAELEKYQQRLDTKRPHAS